MKKLLGVNIDHVATLRQQRKEDHPSILEAAKVALHAGADGITVHLREDRRHIQDYDVKALKEFVPRLNLEMAATEEMTAIALKTQPQFCCLVPEKREELTTEGGLDVLSNQKKLEPIISKLKSSGIKVSLFIDPNEEQITAAALLKADYIEIHTGEYAKLSEIAQDKELFKIIKACTFASNLGLRINAGHGLDYKNVQDIVKIQEIEELNIGFSIVSRAIFVGLNQAVSEMKSLLTI